jgi:hypothetical protein
MERAMRIARPAWVAVAAAALVMTLGVWRVSAQVGEGTTQSAEDLRIVFLERRIGQLEARLAVIEGSGSVPPGFTANRLNLGMAALRTPGYDEPGAQVLIYRKEIKSGDFENIVVFDRVPSETLTGIFRVCTQVYARPLPGDAGKFYVTLRSPTETGANDPSYAPASGNLPFAPIGTAAELNFQQASGDIVCREVNGTSISRVLFDNRSTANYSVWITYKRF